MPNAEAVLGKVLYDAAFTGDARSVAAWLDDAKADASTWRPHAPGIART